MIWSRTVSNHGVEFIHPLFFQGGVLFLSTSETKYTQKLLPSSLLLNHDMCGSLLKLLPSSLVLNQTIRIFLLN